MATTLLVHVGELDHRVGEDFGVGAPAERLGLAGFGIVGSEAVELLLLVQGGLEAFAFLREHVQENGAMLRLEEFEGLDEGGDVVAVDGAVILQAELLEDDAGPEHALGGFLGFLRHAESDLAADAFDEARGAFVQVIEARVGDDRVEVAGNGANVFVDGPLVVVEHDDEAARRLRDVVESFVGDAAGEGGVSGEGDDVLLSALAIARDRHAEGGGESGTGMSGAVAVVRALGAEHEAIQAAGRADGVELLAASGEELVDVGLVADVEDEMVLRRVEDVVHGERELDDSEVRAEMASGLREDRNQLLADFFGEDFELGNGELFDIEWGIYGTEQLGHKGEWDGC